MVSKNITIRGNKQADIEVIKRSENLIFVPNKPLSNNSKMIGEVGFSLVWQMIRFWLRGFL